MSAAIPFSRLLGQRFGRLVVLSPATIDKPGRFILCACDCGKQVPMLASTLIRSKNPVKSCGCSRSVAHSHGFACAGIRPTEYTIWGNMLSRCNNPNIKNFLNYGGRGIAVCERWKNFENFLRDMGPRPSRQYSLDRIDNDGPYCPENCRWATKEQQCNNMAKNIFLVCGDRCMTVTQWARFMGIGASTVFHWVKNAASDSAAHIDNEVIQITNMEIE